MIGLRSDQKRESKLNLKKRVQAKILAAAAVHFHKFPSSVSWKRSMARFSLGSSRCVVADVCFCGQKGHLQENHLDLMTIALNDACV